MTRARLTKEPATVRPKRIEVVRTGCRAQVVIDGEVLPFAMPGDSDVVVEVNVGAVPTVTLTLMADRVDVINQCYEEGGDSDGTRGPGDGTDRRDGAAAAAPGRTP